MVVEKDPKFSQKGGTYSGRNTVSYADKITPETLRKIIELYPSKPNREVAETVGLSQTQLNTLAMSMRRNGVKLKKTGKPRLDDLVKEALKNLKK